MRWLTATLLTAALCGPAFAEDVPQTLPEPAPLPRPRPAIWPEPRSFAEAAGPGFDTGTVTAEPSNCRLRLNEIATVAPMPRLIGPGTCGGGDMVEIAAVLLSDKTRVTVEPPALLGCPMAEAFATWLREEVAPQAEKLGSKLAAVENYDSYECRTRNRLPDAKLSEHAHGEAIDVRALHLADGRRLELTDVQVDKPMRVALHDTACLRFTTVLGPGDPFHSNHIHLDVIARRNGYRICQWDVREPPPPEQVPLPRPRPASADAR